MNIELPEWVQNPIAQASAAVGSLLGLLNLDVLMMVADAAFASAPQIFSVVMVGGLTLPNFIPPETPLDAAGLAAATLFGLYLLHKINENFDERGL